MEISAKEAKMRREPGAVEDRPRKHEDGFHVENDKQHRDYIETGRITASRVAFGGNAALVRQKFCRATAGYRTNQFEDKKRDDGKGKHQQREDEDRNVGRRH